MTELLVPLASLGPALQALLGLSLGLALGWVHFTSLHKVTRLYLSGGPIPHAIALQLLRLAAVGAGLVFLALVGAPALLAGALGLLIARGIVLRRAKRAA